MFFTRTCSYTFPISKDALKSRLAGRHVKIHDLDFEVLEKENKLSIIPHAEQVNAIKTLPITSVVITEANGQSKVVVTSKMRQLDSGGPFLIVLFCAFMFVASIVLYKVANEPTLTYILFGMSLGIFTIFCVRLQMGYFDYVRKIRAYVREKASPSVPEMSMPLA